LAGQVASLSPTGALFAALSLIAAILSFLRGKRYIHEIEA
jgi:hypothetical protein